MGDRWTHNEANYLGEIVDCFSGVVNDCIMFNSEGASDKLRTIELILREEGAEKDLLKKVDCAKDLLSKVSSYCTRCKEYHEDFLKLKRYLFEIQEARRNNYNNNFNNHNNHPYS